MTRPGTDDETPLFPRGRDEVLCPSCGLPEEGGKIEHTAEVCASWSAWRGENRRKFWSLDWGVDPPPGCR